MTELKRIKIDEHIKSTAGTNQPEVKRKRGRPRKNPIVSGDAKQAGGIGSTLSFNAGNPIHEGSHAATQSPKIEPVYDTTEEAKAFIRAPFDIMAGLTGIADLALYPHQLDALAPSFKVVYDRRIAPFMGQNADLYAFAIVLSGIAFEKVLIFKQHQEKARPQAPNKTTDDHGAPIIPHEVIHAN